MGLGIGETDRSRVEADWPLPTDLCFMMFSPALLYLPVQHCSLTPTLEPSPAMGGRSGSGLPFAGTPLKPTWPNNPNVGQFLVEDAMPPLITHILVPFDFSPCCRSALDYAAGLAAHFNASIALFHAQATPAHNGGHWPGESESTAQVYEQYQHKLKERADDARAQLQRAALPLEAMNVSYTLELHDGVPHEAIIARATEGPCDLIIMGTHGRTGWRHMFMGSTAERVLREAPCPVLTIRQPQDDSNT